ncbi:N-acetylglucosamine-6-phosphate deacetylase [Okibacterium endophyticum]
MSPPRTLIHSARLVSHRRIVDDAWVLFERDRVGEVGTGNGWHDNGLLCSGTTIVDAAGDWLVPGFVDIHGHGGGGVSYDDGPSGPETLDRALAVHRERGTTRSVLSLVTGSLDDLCSRLAVIADRSSSDPTVLGAHLEGPFLSPAHRGAHDPEHLMPPDDHAIGRLLDAGRGAITQITLAPELDGGLRAVERFTEQGVRVAVGHTDANDEQARAAFDAGASILTHAFNGMNGIHHRAPGPVVAAMASDGVTLEIVNDGVHVHPHVVGMVFAASPGRVAMVSDSMAATGAPDGEYLLGSLPVTVSHGVARLTHGGSIAGSTMTLDTALRHAVQSCGVDMVTAVTAVTETPARAVGRSDLGMLAPGCAADAVLLGSDLRVIGVWAAGERVRSDL